MALQTLPVKFGALADPTRLAIVERLLSEGEQNVGALAAPFAISLPAISKHLKVLEDAGLVSRRVEHRFRYVSARPEAIRDLDMWVERYRRYWERAFDRLDRALNEAEPETTPRKRKPKESDNG